MISLEPFRHFLTRCPCGHDEHTTRAGWHATNNPDLRRRGGAPVSVVACAACMAIEEMLTIEHESDVRLTFVSGSRVERTGIAVGQAATISKQACRVVLVDEVTKLDGAIHTGVYRVGLRRVA